MSIRIGYGVGIYFHGQRGNSGTSAQGGGASASIEETRQRLRAASVALVSALRELTSATNLRSTSSAYMQPAVSPMAKGQSPRFVPVLGGYSVLAATREINTQTSTVRTSSAPLGLDLVPRVSTLESSALALDVTSPAAPSRLDSSAAVGLDVTSPAAASSLRSSSAIGLDLASPDRPSVLSSSAVLHLDVTSPESGSTVSSAALGLDVTSPDAPSVLSSSAVLGLDVTSPETASVLESSATLGLDVTSPEAASTITSTAELNTSPTTFSAYDVAFSSGTSRAQFSGTYSGPATSLTIKVTSLLTTLSASPSAASFNVLDQNNTVIGSFSGSLAAGQVVDIGATGLKVRFTAGSFSFGATATTNVSQTPATVSATAAFNDAWGSAPLFDAFQQVTAGSFTVNGVSITVNANDTINAVIASINASAAGVTASLSGDKITLTSNASSEDDIALAGDTSGFLAATKLSAATTSKGNIQDDTQVLAKTTQFGSVVNGSFTVNGVSISVDKNADSLSSVISRINAAGAGVTASYDVAQDKLTLTGTTNSEELIAVASDTSGFLTAAKLATNNTTRGNLRDDQQTLAKTTQFATVTTGSFTVNGVSISVDKDTDTLTSVVSRINGAGAGVTAAYGSGLDKLVLTATTNSADLITVASDTTGFLSAAHLDTNNTVRGHLSEDIVALSQLSRFSSVANGSFVVDGQTISVATTDTIQSIVSRINSSGARATAAFDPVANKITLTTSYDSEDDVPVGSDTSGFLAAAGISAASTVKGNIRDDQQFLAKTTQFSGLTSGTFVINGATISLDKDTDTLATLLANITSSAAGVTATYDAVADKVVLTGTTNSEDLITADNDSTTFLDTAHLSSSNTVRGHLPEDGVALHNLAPFQSLTYGSFELDGKTIDVTWNDTIQTLVTKINTSGARVTARYDAPSDKLVLDATYDSEDDIPIGNDTSGFLAAVNIDAANTVKGNLPDDVQVLSKTSQFGAVTSGSFDINGTTITVDVTQDTLTTLLANINASNAGVTATYDSADDKIKLVGTTNSEDDIVVGNDSTGFLAAGFLSTNNTVRGNLPDDTQALSKTSQFAAVTDGSFTINGVAIAVDVAMDSVQSLVTKINGASAGVTATYDAVKDKLVLTGTTPTEDLIAVAGDTSGFLAAAGLDTSNTVSGNAPDDQQAFAQTSQFASVANGSFQVNGHAVSIDASADSLQTVIGRINGAGAGVTASYDAGTDTMIFTPDVAGSTLVLDGDTSGFLAAVNVAAGATGTRVNPDGAFNATGMTSALLDPGASVHAGAFTVNGVTIAVAADDSLNSVLAKISASNAHVTATYDSATETVKLTSARGVGVPTLGSDTSGFLAAVKLDANTQTVAGELAVHPFDDPLATMPEYAAVTSGTMSINGKTIAIDPAMTTINGLVADLNKLPNLSATVDEATGAFTLTSKHPGMVHIAASDDSGLLARLGITKKHYYGRVAHGMTTETGMVTESNAGYVQAKVAAAVDLMNGALAQLENTRDATLELRASVKSTLQDAIDALGNAGLQGLSLADDGTQMGLAMDRSRFQSTLDANVLAVGEWVADKGARSTAIGGLADKFTRLNSLSADGRTLAQLRDDIKAAYMLAG